MSASPSLARNRAQASLAELRALAFKKGVEGSLEGALRVKALIAEGLSPNAKALGRFGELGLLDPELWRAACFAPGGAVSELARAGCSFEAAPGAAPALEWSAERGRWGALSELLALPVGALPTESSEAVWSAVCSALTRSWEDSTLSRHGVMARARGSSSGPGRCVALTLALALATRMRLREARTERKAPKPEPASFSAQKEAALAALAERLAPSPKALGLFFETLCSPGMRWALEAAPPSAERSQLWLEAALRCARSSLAGYVCQAEPLRPMRLELEGRTRWALGELTARGARAGPQELTLACAQAGAAALAPLLDLDPGLAAAPGCPPPLWSLATAYSSQEGELNQIMALIEQLSPSGADASFYRSQSEALDLLLRAGADPSERGPDGLLPEEALAAAGGPALSAHALFALAGAMGGAPLKAGWRAALAVGLRAAREAWQIERVCAAGAQRAPEPKGQRL